MKVKELAENLKTTTVELINKLSNVIFTEKITEEYEVSKDLEKKLAKMYGVSYPFKSNKPKSLNRPAVRIGSNKQEDELKSKSFSNQKPSKSSIPNNSKPVSNSLKSSEKRENQKNSVIKRLQEIESFKIFNNHFIFKTNEELQNDKELVLAAVIQNWKAIEYISLKTDEMCREALLQSLEAAKFIHPFTANEIITSLIEDYPDKYSEKDLAPYEL